MTNKNQIKQYLQDRLQGLESIKKEREWTTAELGDVACCKQTLAFIDSLQEEPTSNDLEEAAYQFGNCFENHFGLVSMSFIKGAKWQKEQMIDKACNYLFSHMGLFVTFFDDDIVEDIERSEFIKKFRIAMEDKL